MTGRRGGGGRGKGLGTSGPGGGVGEVREGVPGPGGREKGWGRQEKGSPMSRTRCQLLLLPNQISHAIHMD